MVKVKNVVNYLKKYIEQYRLEYQRFIALPPKGSGYPSLKISPYLYSKEIICYVSNSGVAIADYSQQPAYDWYIAGGPAIVIDTRESKTPANIIDELKRKGLYGKQIGLYRIVGDIPEDVWNGNIGTPDKIYEESFLGIKITAIFYNIKFSELVQYLTFGAFCGILDIKLPTKESDFWIHQIIRYLGFLTADRKNKTFFNYLELSPHIEEAAWDTRNISVRIQSDIRRDFNSLIIPINKGGSFSFGELTKKQNYDRLTKLKYIIDSFETLLDEKSLGNEKIFHDFLKDNPIMLDFYGTVESKPKLSYPDEKLSPIGKKYVEPDFIIKYPANYYKIVEIEKPSKYIATKKGQARSEVTQATFQIAEFKTYIKKNYSLLKDRYPEISANCSTMLVISRTSIETIGVNRSKEEYMSLLKEQYSVDEIFTYDDLLDRAKQAYIRLTN